VQSEITHAAGKGSARPKTLAEDSGLGKSNNDPQTAPRSPMLAGVKGTNAASVQNLVVPRTSASTGGAPLTPTSAKSGRVATKKAANQPWQKMSAMKEKGKNWNCEFDGFFCLVLTITGLPLFFDYLMHR
jgi:hypothetical protein